MAASARCAAPGLDLDNAMAGRCVATLKAGRVAARAGPPRAAARLALFAWLAVRSTSRSSIGCCRIAPPSGTVSVPADQPQASRPGLQRHRWAGSRDVPAPPQRAARCPTRAARRHAGERGGREGRVAAAHRASPPPGAAQPGGARPPADPRTRAAEVPVHEPRPRPARPRRIWPDRAPLPLAPPAADRSRLSPDPRPMPRHPVHRRRLARCRPSKDRASPGTSSPLAPCDIGSS